MVAPKKLYDLPFSGNGYKVRLALAQLGIPVAYEVVDFQKGETRAPGFLAKNPMGQIPVLELTDGTYLRESNAILYWLAESTHLMPADALSRARFVQWAMFEQNHIDKVIGRARFLRAYPEFRPTTEEDFAGWLNEGNQALAIMEADLAGRAFFAGEHYSIADICLYGYVHCAAEGGFDLARFPRVSAWIGRVSDQPRHILLSDAAGAP